MGSSYVITPEGDMEWFDAPWERTMDDPINNPTHYTSHPSGIECIEITEHFNFNIGNVIKYVWRAGLKTEDPLTDLNKARFYIEREITRIESKT